VQALRAKNLPVEVHTFPGEQHGFRRADTLKTVYTAELAFYGRVFGFSPQERFPAANARVSE
jgi:dipeptidyl aminopeptidase/acylaminoacyl peptidase